MSREYEGGYPRDYLRSTYIEAIVKFGGLPVLLPNLPSSVDLLADCQGLMLTGGGDFDPVLFHQPDRGTDWSGVCPERDATELALMAEADRRGLAILGICRGIQALAVGFGGALVQDIASAFPDTPIKHSQAEVRRRVSHAVTVMPETRMHAVLGQLSLEVNSFHHQSVERVPAGWVASARADDGLIEAMEKPGERYVLGVQWHPEDLVGDEESARRIFVRFIEAASQVGLKERT